MTSAASRRSEAPFGEAPTMRAKRGRGHNSQLFPVTATYPRFRNISSQEMFTACRAFQKFAIFDIGFGSCNRREHTQLESAMEYRSRPEAQERRHLSPKQAGWNGRIPVIEEAPNHSKATSRQEFPPSPRLRRDVLQLRRQLH